MYMYHKSNVLSPIDSMAQLAKYRVKNIFCGINFLLNNVGQNLMTHTVATLSIILCLTFTQAMLYKVHVHATVYKHAFTHYAHDY